MLAEATNQTAGLAVPLTFKHQLAKVTVLLTSGDEEDGETFSAMSIYTRGSRIADGNVIDKLTKTMIIGAYKKDAKLS